MLLDNIAAHPFKRFDRLALKYYKCANKPVKKRDFFIDNIENTYNMFALQSLISKGGTYRDATRSIQKS